MSRERGLTLTEVLIIVAMVLVIAAIAIPGLISSNRASNERTASTTLKTLTAAQADFRANDRDWNHVNDFWTADVKSLYTMTRAGIRGAGTAPDDPPIRLIDIETAAADADPTFFAAGGENMTLQTFAPPATLKGYWYAALLRDQTVKDTPEAIYKQDTAGTPPMGKVHNTSKFGFLAFPDSWSTGAYNFRVNENNTIFREKLIEKPRTGHAVPPGLNAVPPAFLDWPEDETLKSYLRRLD